jgi:hypothetical protein
MAMFASGICGGLVIAGYHGLAVYFAFAAAFYVGRDLIDYARERAK